MVSVIQIWSINSIRRVQSHLQVYTPPFQRASRKWEWTGDACYHRESRQNPTSGATLILRLSGMGSVPMHAFLTSVWHWRGPGDCSTVFHTFFVCILISRCTICIFLHSPLLERSTTSVYWQSFDCDKDSLVFIFSTVTPGGGGDVWAHCSRDDMDWYVDRLRARARGGSEQM